MGRASPLVVLQMLSKLGYADRTGCAADMDMAADAPNAGRPPSAEPTPLGAPPSACLGTPHAASPHAALLCSALQLRTLGVLGRHEHAQVHW